MDKVKQNIIQQQQLDMFNIEKSVVGTEAYYINQDIQKGMSQDEIIEKARSGVYKLTAENKKMGRVGQRYGESKKESGTDELMGIKVGEEVQLGNIKGTLVRNTFEKYGKYSIKTPAEKILLKDSDLENLKPLSKESTDKKEPSENQKLFDKLQKDFESKTEDLQSLSGWEDLLNKHNKKKDYGSNNKVKIMSIGVTSDLQEKSNYFTVRPSHYSTPNYGKEADDFYSEVKSLESKKFTSASEAAKAADNFANKMNS
jgi:hypothetical protein